ncbi:MAG: bifunctional folylpolyglutamate synthase/dihydrofolate synthase, partial [Candidatus Hydrogenedentes bacterium]|nr:bifunctional folylpolyglutamate synthase/dihydrofolate synthase [Candidatus Hydrogenedentota bacterium]
TSEQEYLASLAMHGIKLGLDNISFLLRRAGDPQFRYPTVHVAGTNGKGSVVAFLDAMFRAAGYRTGKFTSPHLIHLNERFQIDGRPIADGDLDGAIAKYRNIASDLEYPPTFFELNTAIAFDWFAREQVDIALVEVGMGGRLDSTNVISPIVTAITNIDLEHTAYLGNTLAAIAGEKAGILKPGVPVAITETKAEPLAVLMKIAEEKSCPVQLVGRDFTYDVRGAGWEQRLDYRDEVSEITGATLGLAGTHQGANAACAITLARQLARHFPCLQDAHILAGLANAKWPGRLERVMSDPPVIFDVAHNVAGARRLVEAIDSAVTVIAVSSDKDAAGMIHCLAKIAQPLILTTFSGKRSLPLDSLREAAGELPCETVPSLRQALHRALALASADRPLLVTGSIYAAGEARQILIDEFGAPPPEF